MRCILKTFCRKDEWSTYHPRGLRIRGAGESKLFKVRWTRAPSSKSLGSDFSPLRGDAPTDVSHPPFPSPVSMHGRFMAMMLKKRSGFNPSSTVICKVGRTWPGMKSIVDVMARNKSIKRGPELRF